MLPYSLAPPPAAPTPGYRQPVRHGQVRHATAVLTAALHSPLVHRLIDGRLCVLRFVAATGHRFTHRTVPYAQTTDGDLIVPVASADDDGWWRTFTMPHPVKVRRQRWPSRGLSRVRCSRLRKHRHDGIAGRIVRRRHGSHGADDGLLRPDAVGLRHRRAESPSTATQRASTGARNPWWIGEIGRADVQGSE
jgi:hypothetical protein